MGIPVKWRIFFYYLHLSREEVGWKQPNGRAVSLPTTGFSPQQWATVWCQLSLPFSQASRKERKGYFYLGLKYLSLRVCRILKQCFRSQTSLKERNMCKENIKSHWPAWKGKSVSFKEVLFKNCPCWKRKGGGNQSPRQGREATDQFLIAKALDERAPRWPQLLGDRFGFCSYIRGTPAQVLGHRIYFMKGSRFFRCGNRFLHRPAESRRNILLCEELPQARPVSRTLMQWNRHCLNFPRGCLALSSLTFPGDP